MFSINGIYNDNKQSEPDKGEAKKTFSGKFYKGEGIPNICLECSEKQAFLKETHNFFRYGGGSSGFIIQKAALHSSLKALYELKKGFL